MIAIAIIGAVIGTTRKPKSEAEQPHSPISIRLENIGNSVQMQTVSERPASRETQPLPPLELFDFRPASIFYDGWGWHERDDTNVAHNCFLAVFRNKPAPLGQSTRAIPNATAHLVYRNSQGEQLPISFGTWLDKYAHFADFFSTNSHRLVVSAGVRAGMHERAKDAVYAFDNPSKYDPRQRRFQSGRVLYAPKEKLFFSDCSEVEISIVSGGTTIYHSVFKCSLDSDGTMKRFSALTA